jgi:hypothetical protein
MASSQESADQNRTSTSRSNSSTKTRTSWAWLLVECAGEDGSEVKCAVRLGETGNTDLSGEGRRCGKVIKQPSATNIRHHLRCHAIHDENSPYVKGCEPYGHQLRRRCSRAASRYSTAGFYVCVRASLGAMPRRALHRGRRHSPSFPCDFTCTSCRACEASTRPMFVAVRGDRVLPGVRWRHDLQSLSCCGSLSAKKETTSAALRLHRRDGWQYDSHESRRSTPRLRRPLRCRGCACRGACRGQRG